VRLCSFLRFSIGLGLGFSVSLAAAHAELAMTGASVTMRAGPAGKAAIVERIPRSTELKVLNCARGWCHVRWRSRYGYIPADAVVLPPATLPRDELPPPVVDGPPTYVTPPVWRWQGPYIGGNLGVGGGNW
jgi:hypothetical protein